MEKIQVVLYDDMHHSNDGSLVVADASHVLELDGQRVKLDLTEANFEELGDFLAEYLAAGSPIAIPGAAANPGRPGGRKGVSPDPERVTFNEAMRLWAAWQDRVEETKTRSGSGVQYYWSSLRKDVAAWLDEHHMAPAEFTARAKAGEYPAKDAS